MIRDLAQYFHIYVVDLLGMGSSGRPEFPLKEACSSVEVAETFFIESFQQWKDKVGISGKVHLMGHSFGGYIAAVYAMRYPSEIQKLILLSTVGIPERQ